MTRKFPAKTQRGKVFIFLCGFAPWREMVIRLPEICSKAGNLGTSDAEQLEFATNQKRVLLTHNRVDFEELAKQYFEENRTHCGIIIAVRRSLNEMAQRLLEILNQTTAEEMINQIRYI